MTNALGVDVSFDDLTPQKIDLLKQAGRKVFGQCLWTGRSRPVVALDNLRMAANAGFLLTAYGSVTSTGDGGWHAQQTRAGVPDDLWAELRLVPCDVELPQIPAATIRAFVEQMAAYDQRRAIYTSAGQWIAAQNNDQSFHDCLLVLAAWDNDPNLWLRVPFGGWTPQQLVGVQYAPGSLIGGTDGLYADSDAYDLELLTEGRMYTDAQINGLFALTHGAVDELARAFFDHVQHAGGDVSAVQAQVDAIKAKMAAAATALAPATAPTAAPPAP